MKVTLEKIYRVVSTDSYQQTNVETTWTTNRQSCVDYINNSYYKHCLHIEESTLADIAFKI